MPPMGDQSIVVVEDDDHIAELLELYLTQASFRVFRAATGEDGLGLVAARSPDLVVLDIGLPGLSGYDVCRAIRANPQSGILPVVMVTALDASERIAGLEAGADDFLTKPINQPELIARVKSLLRIKSLYDEVQRQRTELEDWNRTLEQRVEQGVAQVERLSRMKRFFSPQIAELILGGGTDDPLRSHRSEITVVFLDLRGYTAFTEASDPEEVMSVLREYHREMGRLIMVYEGTVERFAGDSIMVFFNDPLPVTNPAQKAVHMALAMHAEFARLAGDWVKRGYNLDFGIGIAQGYATLGAIGFEGRLDYGAIGLVCSLAARLCAQAKGGQTLVSRRVLATIEHLVQAQSVGELTLKGFQRPVPAFNVVGWAETPRSTTASASGG